MAVRVKRSGSLGKFTFYSVISLGLFLPLKYVFMYVVTHLEKFDTANNDDKD
jgi:hypothetical protein